MRKLTLAFAAALAAWPAFAQQTIILPPDSVYGRVGPPNSGPGAAVALQTLQGRLLAGERTIADTNYSVSATNDATIRVFVYTALSTARTLTLLPASSYLAGTQLTLFDRSGSASGSNTVSIAPTGADLINGTNATLSGAIQTALGGFTIETDGVSRWTVIGNPTTNAAIPNSKLAAMPAGTVKCNDTGSSTTPQDCVHLAAYFHKNGTNQTGMSTGAYTRVTWSTTKFNTTGAALSSNTWTAPISGMIFMEGSLFWNAHAASTANPNFTAKFIKNSAGTCNGADVFANVGTPVVGFPTTAITKISGIDQATAGDVYELCGFGTSDDSLNDLGLDGNQAHTHWSVAYIR
jgi:hypothetical protein